MLTYTVQDATISRADQRGLLIAKSFYFIFFAAIGCIAPFFNIYLDAQGLNGVQIGWLGSIPPLIALVSNPFWGMVADRWKAQRLVLSICALIAGWASLFFLSVTEFWPIMAVVIVLFFFRAPIPAILDSAVMAMVTRTGKTYGRQRLWGSVGFVLASVGLGRVITASQLDLIFWLHALLLGGVLFVLTFMLPIERFTGNVNLLGGLAALSRQRSYVGFLLAMVMMGMASAGYINFLGLHIVALGGANTLVGLAYAASAVTEIPVMFLGARWFSKFSNAQLITIGMSIFIASWTMVGAMRSPWAAIGAAAMVGIGYGFFWVAVVGFASESAPEGMRSTAQAIVGAAQGGLGWGLGALWAGFLWDWGGGSTVFWSSATIVAVGLVIFRLGLRTTPRPTHQSAD
ncbi:MAG: MFS transporter [Caldilineaceae bacterium]|nr:MFS transporter [Caldilineaceae bacterium]